MLKILHSENEPRDLKKNELTTCSIPYFLPLSSTPRLYRRINDYSHLNILLQLTLSVCSVVAWGLTLSHRSQRHVTPSEGTRSPSLLFLDKRPRRTRLSSSTLFMWFQYEGFNWLDYVLKWKVPHLSRYPQGKWIVLYRLYLIRHEEIDVESHDRFLVSNCWVPRATRDSFVREITLTLNHVQSGSRYRVLYCLRIKWIVTQEI